MYDKPTQVTYDGLQRAYDHFNKELFHGKLPGCLITLQRKKSCYGYHAHERFSDGETTCNEIALNPDYFDRESREILSTLVHEMCHLQQDTFMKPARKGYHNEAWAKLMDAVGLIPTATGKLGGKRTGQSVTHIIQEGGEFDVSCDEFLKDFDKLLVDLWAKNKAPKKPRTESKQKYTCSSCGLNAWAKPDIVIVCGDCHVEMQ